MCCVVFVFSRIQKKRRILKKNPLKNKRVMGRLNPYDKVMRKAARELEARRKMAKTAALDAKRGVSYFSNIAEVFKDSSY